MNKTTLALLLLASMTSAHAQLRVDAEPLPSSTTTKEPSADQEPSADKESATSKRQSADKNMADNKESSTQQQLSEDKNSADHKQSSDQPAQSEDKNTSNDKQSSDQQTSSEDKNTSEDKQSSDQQAQSEDKNTSNDKQSSDQQASSEDKNSADNNSSSAQQEPSSDTDETDEKKSKNEETEKSNKRDLKESTALIKEAAKRGTPPWTNDSANIHLQLSRGGVDQDKAEPYKAEDFKIKPQWERWFAGEEHFSTHNGEEVYEVLCQACHMPDGQGAQGAGHFPSFVGNERLRSPDYPIAVILNGFRGMPPFSDMLSDQQVAEVVNHLRTHFGNQLVGDTTAEDVARVRQED